MKILIIGKAGSGKSTVARLLSKELNRSHISTSDFAFTAIWPALREAREYEEPVRAKMYKDRDRELWGQLIALMNHYDPAALLKSAFMIYDIVEGCRKRRELDAIAATGKVGVAIFLDPGQRVPHHDPSFDIDINDYNGADQFKVRTDGPIENLEKIVSAIAGNIRNRENQRP